MTLRSVRWVGVSCLAFLPAVLGACRTGRVAESPATPAQVRTGEELFAASCERAWRDRRVKALYAVVARPVIGLVQRGHLSLFWDGSRLIWKTSLPVAGDVAEGILEKGREGPGGLASLLSARLNDDDALAVFLGCPACGRRVLKARMRGDSFVLDFDESRTAVLTEGGQVVELGFPAGVTAILVPGPHVPLSLKVTSRKGKADLRLEAAEEWPEEGAGPPLEGAQR